MASEVESQLSSLTLIAQTARPDEAKGSKLVTSLKRAVIGFDLTGVTKEQLSASSTAKAAIAKNAELARSVHEQCAYFAARVRDFDAFDRASQQLRPFYTDFASVISSSSHRLPLTGLYLLYLLSNSKLAAFHTELELLSVADRKSTSISYVYELERLLMEGSYYKAIQLRSSLPLPELAEPFFARLESAMRSKVAECAETAYESYPVANLPKLLFLSDQAKAMELVKERGWTLSADSKNVLFVKPDEPVYAVPARQMIDEVLSNATQLERIV